MNNLRVFWVQCGGKTANFGDWVGERIVRQVSGRPTSHVDVDRVEEAEIVASGSVLHLIPTLWNGAVWGTGIIQDDHVFRFPNAKIQAVRGKLTAKRLGVDVPLGDPLLLWQGVKKNKYRLGIVPHYVDSEERAIYEFSRAHDSVLVIDMLAQDAADRIASCGLILSSALHGLVVADALGIPNLWTLFSDNKIVGHGFKFRDYYSAFDLDDPIPFRFGGSLAEVEHRITDSWRPRPLAKVCQGLLESFPKDLRAEMPTWEERSEIIGRLVQAGSSVLDLGAGSQVLKRHLVECTYQPCDKVVETPDTIFCDFNADNYPVFRQHYDVVVVSGLLEYIQDPRVFLERIVRYGKIALVSYAQKVQPIEEREKAGWVNHFTMGELESLFDSLRLTWRLAQMWNEQLIYVVSRGA